MRATEPRQVATTSDRSPASGRSRHAGVALLAAVALTAAAAPAAGGPAAVASEEPTVRVLVRFHDGFGARERRLVAGLRAGVRHDLGEVRAAALELPADEVAALRADPAVALVEPEPIYEPFRRRGGGGGGETVPSLWNGLYGLILTRSLEAQARGVTGRGVKLCAADTGIDAKHPDIAPRYRGGVDTRDDDGNPDVGAHPSEGFHGTMVAGVLAAALDGRGVRGVAYEAELYHARVLGSENGFASDIMAGVRHLVESNGCRVVNLSLGHDTFSQIEQDFYRDLVERHDVLIVAAAGNQASSEPHYPAAYQGVVSVSALDAGLGLAGFSNTGNWVDLTGPGVDVLSAAPRGSGREGYVLLGKAKLGATPMTYSGLTGGTMRSRLVDCGTGNTPEEFPRAVRGSIALMRRGDALFATKVENAMAAGAVGAIVYNNAEGGFAGTLGAERNGWGKPWIPTVGISLADGERLAAAGDVKLVADATDWAQASGTSFASPYVAGVAALVRAVAPHLSAAEVVDILAETAQDVGDGGRDPQFGWGLVDAEAATLLAAER